MRNEGLEGKDGKGAGFGGFRDVGRGCRVFGADFFSRQDDVDGVSGLGIGAVKEDLEARDMPAEEAGFFEDGGGLVEVGTAEEKVDILGVAHGGGVDGGDPGGDRVAVGDGVGNAGRFEGGAGTGKAITDAFHGEHHSIEERHVEGQREHAYQYSGSGQGGCRWRGWRGGRVLGG